MAGKPKRARSSSSTRGNTAKRGTPRSIAGKVPGLPDLIAYLMSAAPPDKEPGEYTSAELARSLGWPQGSASCMAKKLVKDGIATCRTAMARCAGGKKFSTTVYRLKAKG